MASEDHNATPEPSTPKTNLLLAVSQSSIKGYPRPSISSSTAFKWVLEKLVKLSPDHFHLNILHVQVPDTDDDYNDLETVYASSQDFGQMKKKEKIRGLHLLEHFVKICNDRKVACSAWVKEGDPKDVISKEAARIKPDMLVLGSRGLGTLKRMFVGTVSVHCTTHVRCPVLVIKRNPEDVPEDPADD